MRTMISMYKTVINLRDVFTKSKFGEVQLGQSIDEVTNILGEPVGIHDNFGDDDEFNVRFLTYDSYEFWFIKYYDLSKEYKLSAFQNDSYNYPNTWKGTFTKNINIDFWILEYGITLKQFEKILKEEGLNYIKYKEHETIYFEFENKAKILFEYIEHLDSNACTGWMFHPEKHFEE